MCKPGQMPIFGDAGWNTLIISLTGDTHVQLISEHLLVCFSNTCNHYASVNRADKVTPLILVFYGDSESPLM
jgi:hypothetical protein